VTIVSNTSPISNLAQIGQLDLVQQLYKTVLIPYAVYQELSDERAGETINTAIQVANWLKVQSVENQDLVNELRSQVNIGEAEAIVLATEQKANRLLIDERLGRQVAIDLGVKVTGVLGILLAAKRQNLITATQPIMDDLVTKANFRVSEQLYIEVLKAAGESS
jgi:hypothetical protein